MMKLRVGLAVALAMPMAMPAMAQNPYPQQPQQPQAAGEPPRDAFGGPPSPGCNPNEGLLMPIHCIHNMIYFGGNPHYGYQYDGQFAGPQQPAAPR